MSLGGSVEPVGPRHAGVKRLRRLARRRRSRSDERAFVVDGPTLLDEALTCGLAVHEVFAEVGAEPDLLDRCTRHGAVVHQVRQGVLAAATEPVTPQRVAAVASFHDLQAPDALARVAAATDPLVLVLVGVSDPGNVGTLLRTAGAVGADAVFCCDDTVDIYNPKAVRASAGALFGLVTVRDAPASMVVEALRASGVWCGGAVVQGGAVYDRCDLAGPTAVVLGSEAHGLTSDLQAAVDGLLTIPMIGSAESLNVAMAGTVVCFEALRQRRWGREGRGG